MKCIFIVLVIIVTSLFLFPFEFTFLPSALNTKLMLSLLGLPVMVYHSIKMKGLVLSRAMVISSFIAIIFSLICLFSLDYNHTTDSTYATYIVSMWVWLLAAYLVVTLIGAAHGYLSIRLVINYLVAVCVLQCVLALIIKFNPTANVFVNTYTYMGDMGGELLKKESRLHGIGAALDYSGMRFCTVLIMIIILLTHDKTIKNSNQLIAIYFSLFLFIAIVGSMIARTTFTGMTISLAYLIYSSKIIQLKIGMSSMKVWCVVLVLMMVFIAIAAYYYNTNKEMYKLIRFAFEGFFNWIETGEWKTNSTNRLQTMYVFPETTKTWLIGDGYFKNPNNPKGYYMGTDVGFLRFIFYCGTIGLSAFSVFFTYLSFGLSKVFPRIKDLFFIFLLMAFIFWLKVATDIFLIYAVFLSVSSPYLYSKYYDSKDLI